MESAISGGSNTESQHRGSSAGDVLTQGKLQELQEIFEAADTDGEGGLSMSEFRTAMRITMGDHVTDHELDMLFMKVDTNCDGTVDWDEYLNYMLLESMEKDSMNILAMQPFSKNVAQCKGEHHDSIVCILHMPSMLRGSTARGSYVSVSQEGTVCLWDYDMKLRNTYHVQDVPGVDAAEVWVTNAALLNVEHILIIATTACQLLFFIFTKFRFELMCCITNLDSSATCLSICTHEKTDVEPSRNYTYIVWGDMEGSVSALVMSAHFSETKFFPHPGPDNEIHIPRFTFSEILLGFVDHAEGYKIPAIHCNYVLKVAFIPKLHSILSCSKDSRASLYLGDLDQKVLNNYFKVFKGVNSFDYCPQSNIIVTGGYDSIIRVWNPYVPSQPVMLLKSHRFPIHHVLCSSAKELVYSVAENKEVRIHDLTAQICLQTFYRRKMTWLGSRPVTAALFNPIKGALVIGTTTLALFSDYSSDANTDELTSHSTPVTIVLYNPLFQQIVSTCQEGSSIVVWKFNTGERVMQFRAEQNSREEGVSAEVSTMRFDPTYRRLITAMRSGSVKIWNFNNGCCVQELPVFDEGLDICDVVVTRERIFTAGWNRRITVYMDSYEDDTVYWLEPGHKEDVVSMATFQGTLASASYDGVIFLWSLDTNRLTDCLTIDGRTKTDVIGPTSVQGTADQGNSSTSVKAENEFKKPSNNAERDSAKKMVTHVPSYCKVFAAESRIEKLLFLEARNNAIGTATLMAAYADGLIRAWSIRTSEGQLGSFLGSHTDEENAVLCLASDPNNAFLITGDACGHVKVWDIRHYCNPDCEETVNFAHEDFPFFQWKQKVSLLETESGWLSKYACDPSYPPLLTAFRGHLKAVTSVDYANFFDREFVLSSSVDCSIRLWTIQGEFLALYGQSRLFSYIPLQEDNSCQAVVGDKGKKVKTTRCNIPKDIRECGSATTLHIVKGTRRSYWFYVKCLIHGMTCFGIRAKTLSQTDVSFSAVTEGAVEPKADTSIAAGKSDVIWKGYKRVTKYKPLPNLPPPREDETTISVWGCLPYCELETVHRVATPSVIVEMKQRRQEQEPFADMANIRKTRRATMFRKAGKKH